MDGLSIAGLLRGAIEIYIWIVVINAVLSWFVYSSRNMIVRKIYWMTNQFVDPVLDPIRRVLSPVTRGFGIDISPFILIMLLWVIRDAIQV
jgi:YggT family protein